ncbi:winged helix-turn-helix domain-containing protein [Halobacteriaceae archaeon GCM10025711]
MAHSDAAESPLEAASGAAGQRATEAFSVLGHETRLAILLALWEAYEPFEDDNAVSFAELRKRVGMSDGSQFNYHLQQLVGQFVRQTDDGYELRRAGHQLVRTVIAGAGIQDPVLEPTEVDQACYLCGGSTVVSYRDEMLFWACTECDGLKDAANGPAGVLAGREFDPAGFTDRSPEELLNAAWTGGYSSPAWAGCVTRVWVRWTAGCTSATTTRARDCAPTAGGGRPSSHGFAVPSANATTRWCRGGSSSTIPKWSPSTTTAECRSSTRTALTSSRG